MFLQYNAFGKKNTCYGGDLQLHSCLYLEIFCPIQQSLVLRNQHQLLQPVGEWRIASALKGYTPSLFPDPFSSKSFGSWISSMNSFSKNRSHSFLKSYFFIFPTNPHIVQLSSFQMTANQDLLCNGTFLQNYCRNGLQWSCSYTSSTS